jgi:hypothetical protein
VVPSTCSFADTVVDGGKVCGSDVIYSITQCIHVFLELRRTSVVARVQTTRINSFSRPRSAVYVRAFSRPEWIDCAPNSRDIRIVPCAYVVAHME